jgi:hypothetical protein
MIGRALVTELAKAIPGGSAAVLSGLGHLAPEERPSEIAEAILIHRSRTQPVARSATETTRSPSSTPAT